MGEKEIPITGKDPLDGDPNGGKDKKDDEEMVDQNSAQTEEQYNHNVCISIKEKQGEETKYLQMMFQLRQKDNNEQSRQ